MAVNVGSAVGYLDLDISGFMNNIRTAQIEAETQTNLMTSNIDSRMKSVGSGLSSAGTSMSKNVTVPAFAAATAISTVGSKFESSMSKVKAISGSSAKDTEMLTEKAKQMGLVTKFSATDSAEAFKYMSMAGWDASNMVDGIDGIMALAAADGLDLATTSDIVTDAITAFGLKASDSAHFADVLARASSSANTDVSKLGESFKYAAPVAGSLGYSVEDTSLALGIMANSGIKASQAGNSLKTAFTNMVKPSKQMQDVMDNLNLSATNQDGSMKSLKTVMDELRDKFALATPELKAHRQSMTEAKMIANGYADELKGLSKEEKEQTLARYAGSQSLQDMTKEQYKATVKQKLGIDISKNSLSEQEKINLARMVGAEKLNGLTQEQQASSSAALFGKESMSGMLAIINASSDDYDNLSSKIGNADGTAQKMADTMSDNLSGQFALLKSALEGLAIQLYEIILPYLKEFVAKIQEWVEWFSRLSKGQQTNIVKMVAFAAAIGPALVVVGKLIKSLGIVVGVAGKIPGAFSLAGKGIKGISSSFKGFGRAMTLAKSGFPALASQSSLLFKAFTILTGPVGLMIAAVGLLIGAFVSLWKNNENFRNNIIEIWNGIKDSFEMFTGGLVERLNDLGFNFKDFSDVIKAVWDGFTAFLAPVFEIAFATIGAVLDAAFKIILGLLDIFIGLFTGDWEKVWDGLSGIVQAGFDMVKTIFESAYKYINEATGGAITSIVEWFASLPNKILNFINDVLTNITNWGNSMGDKATETGTSFINNVVEFFQNLPYNIGFYTALTLINIGKFVTSMINKAIELGKNFVDGVVNFIKNLPTNLSNIFTSAFTNTKIWAINMINKSIEMGTKFIENVIKFFKTLPENAKEWFENTIKNAKEWVKNMHKEGGNAIAELIKNFIEGAKEIPKKMQEIGKNIVDGVWNGIVKAKDVFTSKVKGFFSDIVDGVQDAMDINSPSGVMRDKVGYWLPLGVADGFKNAMPKALKTMQGLMSGGMSALKIKDLSIVDFLISDISVFKNGLKTMYADLLNWFNDVKKESSNVAKEMSASFNDISKLSGKYYGSGIGYVGRDWADSSKNQLDADSNNGNIQPNRSGDTFVFYSQKHITEVEAAKQMKKAKVELAEGF